MEASRAGKGAGPQDSADTPDGFGVAVVREDGKWRCAPMSPKVLTSLSAAETELRELRSAGAVFGLLDIDDEFFLIVRPAPAGTRLLLSDATAALDYDIAAEALETLDADISAEDLEESDPFEEGDLGVLSDIGLPDAVLGVILDETDLYPDEQLGRIAREMGFAEELSAVLDRIVKPASSFPQPSYEQLGESKLFADVVIDRGLVTPGLSALQIRATFVKDGDKWKYERAGQRWRCAGAAQPEWTTQPCSAAAPAAPTLTGLQPIDVSKTPPNASVLALLASLGKLEPEAAEGRPAVKISIAKGDDGGLAAEIERSGLLDDSIEAEAVKAVIVRENNLWKLKEAGRRWRCARKAPAEWTIEPCS